VARRGLLSLSFSTCFCHGKFSLFLCMFLLCVTWGSVGPAPEPDRVALDRVQGASHGARRSPKIAPPRGAGPQPKSLGQAQATRGSRTSPECPFHTPATQGNKAFALANARRRRRRKSSQDLREGLSFFSFLLLLGHARRCSRARLPGASGTFPGQRILPGS
jgi:hypothetical protein